MPYVICARCRLRTYSAALWMATDVCPRCDAELPRRPRGRVVALSEHPRFVDASRTLAEPPPDVQAEAEHDD